MQLHVVTSYFVCKRLAGSVSLGGNAFVQRQREYVQCLHHNMAHRDVQSVCLLVEGRDAYAHLRRHVLCAGNADVATAAAATATADTAADMRLPFTAAQQRKLVPLVRLHTTAMPTYADLFAYANAVLPRGALAMVCNADVYVHPRCRFAATARRLFAAAAASSSSLRCRRRAVLALTRHESAAADGDAPLARDYRGSHDAFVFEVPMASSVVAHTRHCQNSYQAENVVLYELQRAGYTTYNTCYDTRIVHLHAADVRQWLPSVAGTQRYARAPPVTLSHALATLARCSSSSNIDSVDGDC